MPDPLDELRDAARASLAPLEGELVVPGLHEPVEVLRDRWGIPYLTASSLEDLWFAQGFVQASERLFQIDLALRASNGRLSELFAELTLPADRFARTVGWTRIGAREAERWNDGSRAMFHSFVDGARAFVAQMPAPPLEYALIGLAPELPEELGALPRWRGEGSNNWVVAGSRSASGKPLLANDPHLLVGQPAPWFEIHLRAPGDEARGAAVPFAPGAVLRGTAHPPGGITNRTA